MASKYWIKLYHEILDDHKMGRMPDRLWRRTIELFLIAGETDLDGELPCVEDIAWRLRLDDDELRDDLTFLENMGIVHQNNGVYIVTKFSDRQGPMSSAERTQRYRDSKKKEEYNDIHYGTETNTVTNRPTDKIRLDKIRKEKDKDKNNKGGEDLFNACQKIYETKKGRLISDGRSFSQMIQNFKKNGVTADDYEAAIGAMDANPKYTGSKPTSYEKWAIGYADKRKNPSTPNNQSIEKTNEQIIEEMTNAEFNV